MKRILIVNNNLQIGGIQKSLINLLNGIKDEYDVTLMLFSKYGLLSSQIPEGIHVTYSSMAYRFLGIPWDVLKKDIFGAFHKIFCSALNLLFGKRVTLTYLSLFQKRIKEYDVAISYSHCTGEKSLSICCPEFVLDCVECPEKICFIHCDYPMSGTVSKYNNRLYERFDKIACCSHSVKEQFLSVLPNLASHVFVVRNFPNEEVVSLANIDPIMYDVEKINIVSCARLSAEKGIERAIKALSNIRRNDIIYHIVGDGPDKENITSLVSQLGMNQNVSLYGEQANPYAYLKNADYLLIPSFHEAAPMVIDEAKALGIRIISTETLSAKEMLGKEDIICENSLDGLIGALQLVKKTKTKYIDEKKVEYRELFSQLIGEHNGSSFCK